MLQELASLVIQCLTYYSVIQNSSGSITTDAINIKNKNNTKINEYIMKTSRLKTGLN
jgi:hypothetical protein